VPELSEASGLPIAIGLGGVLFVWYLAGNELMRRRAHRLALWTGRVLEPLGGKQSIQWLGAQAFRLEVAEPRPPFSTLTITGLIESWDVPVVWAWNRLHGRRDMVLIQAQLRAQPLWGFEVYRPGTLLAGDARHFARQEGWEETSAEELAIAAVGDPPRRLATELLEVVSSERWRLLRLAVRRQGQHLTLALNVPDPARFDAAEASSLARRLAERVVP
jgi:hypothetical protein